MNARFEENDRHHERQDKLMAKMMDTLEDHSRILAEHSKILNEHSAILGQHTEMLNGHTDQLGSHEDYFHQIFVKLDYHSDLLSEIKTDVRSINVKLDVHEKIFLANPNLYEGKVRFPSAIAMKKAATV